MDLSFWQRLRLIFAFHKPRRIVPEHQQKAFFGLLDRDTVETIKAFILFLVQLFRVLMSCLLIVFVPQLCDGAYCGSEQTLQNLSNLGIATAVVNFTTLAFALIHYHIVFKREKALIDYLHVDDDVGEFQLPKVLPQYKDIADSLYTLNAWLLASSIVGAFFFVANAAVSGVYIFGQKYYSFQTATVYLTNIGLVSQVIENTLDHAWIGMKYQLALSCLEFNPLSYNVIEEAYLNLNDPSKGGRNEDALEKMVNPGGTERRSDLTVPI
jgi:hypothetical protein